MQALSRARRLARSLKPPLLPNLAADHNSDAQIAAAHRLLCHISLSSRPLRFSGVVRGYFLQTKAHSLKSEAFFSTEAASAEITSTEAVKELHDKILESVNTKRTMAPNAWLWSLIENCKNHDDIRLLFETLQNLRRFRLSNLRIHDNFNCHLCREVAKACARVGALDFGKKTLWNHNIYGLTPTVGSANHLLTYAKDHNDAKFMVEVMKLLKRNNVPLQPSTADIVFSICYNSNDWDLISKYSKRFLKAGVKLRRTTFDTWMDFAAKRGDTESLWKIEKLRSESMKLHSLVSGFSCAKGLILEHKPEEAAAVIQILYQALPDNKKSSITVELQKLVSVWPLDVVKHQEEDRKSVVAAALETHIAAMVTGLLNMGLELNVSLEDLTKKEEIPS